MKKAWENFGDYTRAKNAYGIARDRLVGAQLRKDRAKTRTEEMEADCATEVFQADFETARARLAEFA